jgi:hypothetical protein
MRRWTLRISTGTIRRALKRNQQIPSWIVDFTCLGQAEIENIHTVDGLYPVRNNGPLLCSGVSFRIIPAGFNPLEFLIGFIYET